MGGFGHVLFHDRTEVCRTKLNYKQYIVLPFCSAEGCSAAGWYDYAMSECVMAEVYCT